MACGGGIGTSTRLGATRSATPEPLFDLGERALVFHVLHARGRRSGLDVAMPTAHAFEWRDGLLVYSKVYPRREDALRDLGVSEDELEPIAP